MLRRLQGVKANYDVTKWAKERRQTERLIENKCKYDYIFKTPRSELPPIKKVPDFSETIKENSREEESIDEEILRYQNDPKVLKLLCSQNPLPVPPGDLPSNRKVLWRNLCIISDTACIVEFSRSPNKFNIVGYEIERDFTHLL